MGEGWTRPHAARTAKPTASTGEAEVGAEVDEDPDGGALMARAGRADPRPWPAQRVSGPWGPRGPRAEGVARDDSARHRTPLPGNNHNHNVDWPSKGYLLGAGCSSEPPRGGVPGTAGTVGTVHTVRQGDGTGRDAAALTIERVERVERVELVSRIVSHA